jgi:hypothetical protein
MGAAAGPVGGAMSIASVGLSAFSSIEKAKGIKSADEFQAAELDRASQYGELKAVQTGGQMTQRLNQTLGNIDVIRAASHDDPTSPSGVAYRGMQEDIGDTQKSITVENILSQSKQQEADAAYLRVAGSNALLAGNIGAFGQILGGVGSAVSNKSFGLPGSSSASGADIFNRSGSGGAIY